MNTLLTKFKIKKLLLENRIVMPSIGTRTATDKGHVTNDTKYYIKELMNGDFGLIISEVVAVHPTGHNIGQLALFDKSYISGLKSIVDIAHNKKKKIGIQLNHTGRENPIHLKNNRAIGPSSIPSAIWKIIPKTMSTWEIDEVIESYGNAALNAIEAGFDFIEIQAGHGYLIHQFLSPLSNIRSDEYGGNYKSRSLLLKKILINIRNKIGFEVVLSVRVSANEGLKNGYKLNDLLPILRDLKDYGVDLFHISNGTLSSKIPLTTAPPEFDQGFNVDHAFKIKKYCEIPVIAVGRFYDPYFAEIIINENKADLIAFGRQHIADRDFIKKMYSNRQHLVYRCLSCNHCITEILKGNRISCAINPIIGSEHLLFNLKKKKRIRRNICIVGGGPAGLTAAIEASKLKHKVELYESEKQVGGMLNIGSKPPFKGDYMILANSLSENAIKNGVKINLKQKFKMKDIKDKKFDCLIIACGGKIKIPKIPGVTLNIVDNSINILKRKKIYENHFVIIGAGLVGLEVADYLISLGKRIVILEESKVPQVPLFTAKNIMLFKRLNKNKCKIKYGCKVTEIAKNGISYKIENKKEKFIKTDKVILATGLVPIENNSLEKFKKAKIETILIGDAHEPGKIYDAISNAAIVAWSL